MSPRVPDQEDAEREREEERDEEQGYNVPTLYLDGDASHSFDVDTTELERVQLEFDATASGTQSEADERAPLGWCNSATIHLDREEDSVTVLISVGDPRGAFAFTVRRLQDGRLIMHTPYPGESMPHLGLTEIRPGTYEVGS
jgi:hypothetical protein